MHRIYRIFFFAILSFLIAVNVVSANNNAHQINRLNHNQISDPNQISLQVTVQATFTPIPTIIAPQATLISSTTLPIVRSEPQTFFFSKYGDNQGGESWGNAWNELDQINWLSLIPGDTIFVDGGELGGSMVYTSTLEPLASGTEELPIRIELSHEDGRNGQAVLFGGNSVPLPECGQLDWNGAGSLEAAGDAAIWINEGISNLIIDGTKRGGFQIHGWGRAGVMFDPDRTDDGIDGNSRNVTLRFMEIYNNGSVEFRPDLDGSETQTEEEPISLAFPSSGSPGIKLAGTGHRFEYLEIHDNAADAIQSNFTNPAEGVFNNIDDISIAYSWFYNQRPHSGLDNSPSTEICTATDPSGCDEEGAPQMSEEYWKYPDSPVNRMESFNWCTHNDAIQIYSSNDLNGLTLTQSIIGPNMMNALILGDKGEENTTAWVNDLVISDVLITRFTNNALGMNNEKPTVGRNWSVEHMTIYGHFNKQNMGSLSFQSNAAEVEHRIAKSINVFGRGEFDDGNVDFENNCEFNMYTGTLQGVVADPQFAQVDETRDIFANDLAIDFATVFTEDYQPTNELCAEMGSRLTSVGQLMSLYDEESKRSVASKVRLYATPLPTVAVPTNTPIPIAEVPADPENLVDEVDEDAIGDPESFPVEEVIAGEQNLLDALANDTILMILSGLALFVFMVLLFLTWMVWRLQKLDE
ncbi:MAG: hypothetical protein AB8G95_16550 [Anaerolineae bacterium]